MCVFSCVVCVCYMCVMRVARNVCTLCVALSESGGFAVALLIFRPCGGGEKPSFGLSLSAFETFAVCRTKTTRRCPNCLAPCPCPCVCALPRNAMPLSRPVLPCAAVLRLAPSSYALRRRRVLWRLVARPAAFLFPPCLSCSPCRRRSCPREIGDKPSPLVAVL